MIQATITTVGDTDARGLAILCIGTSHVLVGDHVGTFDVGADETTGYPVTLVDGSSTVDDDRDRDELRSTLSALGLGVESDETGLVLVQRGDA